MCIRDSAIPALAFTDKEVEVYIGSYGDIKNTLRLQLGRLKMFFKINIFEWQIGLCRREGEVKSSWHRAIIIIGGPIASLLISIPLILRLKEFQSNDVLFFASIVFIGAAVIDLAVNLYPFSSPMKMHDGGVAYSDGYQLKSMIVESFMPEAYFEFQKLYQDDDYDTLINKADDYIEKNPTDRFAYEFMVESLIEKKEFSKVLEVYSFMKNHLKFEDRDYFLIGKAYRQLDNYPEALNFFKKYYFKHFNDPELINEMAETHIAMGNFSEAIQCIDAGLHNFENNYRFHLNRAIALIKMGDFPSAHQHLRKAEKINRDDPKLYLQFGILYGKLNQKDDAILNLEKAKKMGSQYAGLDFILEEIRMS